MLWTVAASSQRVDFGLFWEKQHTLQCWLTRVSFDLAVAGISSVIIVLVGETGR